MITSHRPLSRKQTNELRSYISAVAAIGRAILLLMSGVLFALLLRGLSQSLWPLAHFLWWCVPSVGFVCVLFFRAKRWTGGPELRARIRSDLAGGILAVHRIEILEAIHVEELEDEGPAYFLKTSDGRVIGFFGQYVDGLKSRGFPWRSFEIEEAPASKQCFRIRKSGEPITPSFVREPLTRKEYLRYVGGKYCFLDAEFESLKIRATRR